MISARSPVLRGTPRPVRCAIYTRVSTDQGLDQEFNSLDAQREASEAYIRSQAHEGWTCLKRAYDDGGYSGGSMERPALQQLLEHVREKKLDIIVVYKVDRLTRSLADFAKLVELFDAHEVSFVSVTQSFNTTSSMGRLTLNVLLSFAQFEREVTGERIRDKVAASRKKGMWMGGIVPLGYRLDNKKLIVEPNEAETVRRIFSLYLSLKSLPHLAAKLGESGILSRPRCFADGRTIGSQPFRTGALSHLLSNRVYVGEVRHHGQHYPGEHEPILERATFEAVAAQLAARRNREAARIHGSGAALQGLLFDSNGNRMVPVHANKSGRRYRYYQSWVLNHGQKDRAGTVNRVPAQEIEDAVWVAVKDQAGPAASTAGTGMARQVFAEVISRIDVHADRLEITWKSGASASQAGSDTPPEPAPLVVPWAKQPVRRRRGVIDSATEAPSHRSMRSEIRARLLKGIAQGQLWLDELVNHRDRAVDHIARHHSLSLRHVRSTLSLALLAPDIVEAAVDGRLPRNLTVTRMTDLPADWSEQRRVLGLA